MPLSLSQLFPTFVFATPLSAFYICSHCCILSGKRPRHVPRPFLWEKKGRDKAYHDMQAFDDFTNAKL